MKSAITFIVFDFPILNQNNEVVSARAESKTLGVIPASSIDYVFVHPHLREHAQRWLAGEKVRLLTEAPKEEEE